MTAFARATDVLFADTNHALDALWLTQGQGAGLEVRVIRSAPDAEVNYGGASIVTGRAIFSVRVSQVAAPDRGDVIQVGVKTYNVQGAPVLDEHELIWRVEADPQYR